MDHMSPSTRFPHNEVLGGLSETVQDVIFSLHFTLIIISGCMILICILLPSGIFAQAASLLIIVEGQENDTLIDRDQK
jgi:hypothetical protein